LDTLLDTDSDNLVAFCAMGVRKFPDGTSKDAYHVVFSAATTMEKGDLRRQRSRPANSL
jgi:hypothetical protein